MNVAFHPRQTRPLWTTRLVLPWSARTLRADTTSLSGATEITSLPCTLSAPGVYYLNQNFSHTSSEPTTAVNRA